MNPTAAVRNLLFGILAVQNGVISRDEFIAAANAWGIDKRKTMRQLLVEQCRLTAEQSDVFDQMVALHVRSHGGDVRKSLESLSSATGLAVPLASIGDADIDRCLTFIAADPQGTAPGYENLRTHNFDVTAEPLKDDPKISPDPFLFSSWTDSGSHPRIDDDKGRDQPTPEPRVGEVLGRFRIIRLIGKGGQGIVYEAADESELGRRVALKTTQEFDYDPPDRLRARRARLAREGRLNAQLDHPFIMSIYGLGTTEAGRPFYAMWYLDQIHLGTALRNFHTSQPLLHDPRSETTTARDSAKGESPTENVRKSGGGTQEILTQSDSDTSGDTRTYDGTHEASDQAGPTADFAPVRFDRLRGQRILDFRNLLERFTDVCDAMHYAHSRRVLHRDLKPGNVMIGTHGETLVIDWGMAKTRAELTGEAKDAEAGQEFDSVSAELDPHARLSSHGVFIGTPGYAPPEQLIGDLTKLNETTDVYALGMVLFEILTGKNPLHCDELRATPRPQWQVWLYTKAMDGAPDPAEFNPTVPRPLAAICRKALAPEQNDRYSTADAMARDVANWLADEPVTAYRDTLRERAQRWTRKNRGKAAAVAATLAFLAVGAILTTLFQAQYTRDIAVQRDIALASESAERKQRELAIANAKLAGQEKNLALKNLRKAESSLYLSKLALAQSAYHENDMRRAWGLLDDCQWNLRGWEHSYLRKLFDTSRQTLYSHRGPVLSVAFSPDGKRVLTGSADKTAKLSDTVSGGVLITFQGHLDWVTSVNFSPDGKRVLTGSKDGNAKLWDTVSGRELRTLKMNTNSSAVRAEFSPDGSRILSVDFYQMKLWDSVTGQELMTINEEPLASFASFSPDGSRILILCNDGKAQIRSAESGHEVLTSIGINNFLLGADWSPDGNRIITTAEKGNTAKVWDASTGLELLTLNGHSSLIRNVSFSHDGTFILTCSEDGTAKIWDSVTGRELRTLIGHSDIVLSAAWSPDGTRILTGSSDRTAKVWEISNRRELLTLKEVSSVVFRRGSSQILAGNGDGTAKLWDSFTGRELLTLRGHIGRVTIASFSPDGSRILTGGEDGTAKLWDPLTGLELRNLKHSEEYVTFAIFSPDGSRILTQSGLTETAKVWETATGRELFSLNRFSSVSFSPDGTRIILGRDDQTPKVWDMVTGRELLALKGHTDIVSVVSYSPNGTRILTACRDGTAKLWDAASGRELLNLKGHSSDIQVGMFSPDGSRILTGSGDFSAKVWDTETGSEQSTLKGHNFIVSSLGFSHDGSLVLTGSYDQTAKLWDALTGRELFTFEKHPGGIDYVTISPDDSQILTRSNDGTAILWKKASGRELLKINGPPFMMISVIFSPDGKSILTGIGDGTAILWDIDSGKELLTLKGQESAVSAVAFSPDGTVAYARDNAGKILAWDLETGEAVPATNPPDRFGTDSARSPDGRYLAEVRYGSVVLIPQNEPLTGTEPWPLPEREERLKYHGGKATGFEKSGQWFAAAFHLTRMLADDPGNDELNKRLETAQAQLPKPAGPPVEKPANPLTLPENPFQR